MLKFITKADIWRQLDAGLHTELGWADPQIHLKTWQDMAVYERLRDVTGLRIAEIGGGASRILPRLAEHNTCCNVDKFNGQLGGPRTEQIIDGVTNVPAYLGEYHSDLADNSFDVVFSVSVVEHVPHTATVAFINDLLRILKPGGVCYHAMSMYVGDSVDPANQRKLDTYAGWLSRPDVSPMEETTATQPLFQSNMGTNPDLTMWKWGQTNATLTEMRCASQSVSLFMGFQKTGKSLSQIARAPAHGSTSQPTAPQPLAELQTAPLRNDKSVAALRADRSSTQASPNQYDLVVLSHHKCATNWIRSIFEVLASDGFANVHSRQRLHDTGGDAYTESAPHILLNVNAFKGSMPNIDLDSQPVMHFVRDPRDALVSNYWSWLKSHKNNGDQIKAFRHKADTLSVEDGMILMVDSFPMGRQLRTWDDQMWTLRQQIRYEELLTDFNATLIAMIAPCGLSLDDATLEALRARTDFTRITGREAGQEDTSHHYRKGVSGDWKNYFTDRLEGVFMERHGWLGEKLGYW